MLWETGSWVARAGLKLIIQLLLASKYWSSCTVASLLCACACACACAFLNKVSLCSSSYPGTQFIDQVSLKLSEICLLLPLNVGIKIIIFHHSVLYRSLIHIATCNHVLSKSVWCLFFPFFSSLPPPMVTPLACGELSVGVGASACSSACWVQSQESCHQVKAQTSLVYIASHKPPMAIWWGPM